MAKNIDRLNQSINSALPWYTASLSPFVQGVEIKQPYQLSAFTNLKIRGNISFGTTVNQVLQEQAFFNDTLASENLGAVGTGSQVTMDTPGTLGVEVIHKRELRDLGISTLFSNDEPFEEADTFETDPTAIISQHPLALVLPTSLVQICSSPSSFDGVMEPFDIRKVVDRSSIEMPYIFRSVKGSMSITTPKRESVVIGDERDLRNSSVVPFLDSVESFGTFDLPGAFSDADQRLAPFADTNDRELLYRSGLLDTEIRDTLVEGFVSASITYVAPRPSTIRESTIVATHGFQFSQNDNYGYDSIAFGGLLK